MSDQHGPLLRAAKRPTDLPAIVEHCFGAPATAAG
jgi:hypothetical protein